jgi:hypothetical protein
MTFLEWLEKEYPSTAKEVKEGLYRDSFILRFAEVAFNAGVEQENSRYSEHLLSNLSTKIEEEY